MSNSSGIRQRTSKANMLDEKNSNIFVRHSPPDRAAKIPQTVANTFSHVPQDVPPDIVVGVATVAEEGRTTAGRKGREAHQRATRTG